MSKLMWTALEELAFIHKYGDEHYGVGNWRKGQPVCSTVDSTARHLKKFVTGEDIDDRSNRMHLGHAAWNCLLLIHQMKYPEKYAHLDDRIDDFGEWVNEVFAATDEAKRLSAGLSAMKRAWPDNSGVAKGEDQ
jgi:hypothetical protein